MICHPTNKGKFRHVFLHTDMEAATEALNLDAQGLNVYFACASYKKAGSRKSDNVHSVRSFWLDIDAGPGKPHATGKDAAKAVLAFARLLQLPAPLIVSSGGGVHAYWTMEDDIEPDDWLRVAEKLKLVSIAAELGADGKRTADIASVLRPVGTHHRKGEPRLVRVVIEGESLELDEFEAALDAYIEEHGVAYTPSYTGPFDLDDDLTGPRDRNCNADRIADQCAVMDLVRKTRGNVDEPTWYHALQILAHCKDGEQLAHEWSNGHPNYSKAETDKKFKHAFEPKPPTCGTFFTCQPKLCEKCPNWGKIRSPIALSYREPPQTIETSKGEDKLPTNYVWNAKDGKLQRKVLIPDDEVEKYEYVDVANTYFYFTDRYDMGEDGIGYQVEYIRQGKRKHFIIMGSVIGKGGGDLLAELGKHEIGGPKPLELQMYLKAWMDKQKEALKEKTMHQHFGWQEKGGVPTGEFLLGNQLYRPGLGPTEVLLKNAARQTGQYLQPHGDYDKWKYIINRAYNHDGLECLQFLVLCGFAAPLFALFRDLGGITVYAYSGKTGKGKSTACQAALSVWGNWQQMMLVNDGTTLNAFWQELGVYHNLPVLFDELTNLDPQLASQYAFGVSHGQPKRRLKASGEPLNNNSRWRTILLATGNNQLSEKLVYNRADPEAEIARIFEFPAWAKHEVEAKEAATLFRGLLENFGHAGIDFVSYLTDNNKAVTDRLIEWREYLIDDLQMTSQERYWSALLASVLCALEICRERNILQFKFKPLYGWIKQQVASNRGNQTDLSADPKQHFSRMLSELATGIIETKNWGNIHAGHPAQLTERRPTGPIVGRLIQNENRLYISTAAVREWCVKRKISATELINSMMAEGWVSPQIERLALGRGTVEYASVTGKLSVYVVDMSKINPDQQGDHTGATQAGGFSDAIAGGRN